MCEIYPVYLKDELDIHAEFGSNAGGPRDLITSSPATELLSITYQVNRSLRV